VSDVREATLRALMTADAAEFARRELGHSYLIEEGEDKITMSKRMAEVKRLARVRQQRIAAGLPVNRSYRPTGTMVAGEAPDGFHATDGLCVVCNRPVDRVRSRTCSPECARAIRAARKASVNHTDPRGME